jgi:hypothetical protein
MLTDASMNVRTSAFHQNRHSANVRFRPITDMSLRLHKRGQPIYAQWYARDPYMRLQAEAMGGASQLSQIL